MEFTTQDLRPGVQGSVLKIFRQACLNERCKVTLWGFRKIGGTFLGVPIIRITKFKEITLHLHELRLKAFTSPMETPAEKIAEPLSSQNLPLGSLADKEDNPKKNRLRLRNLN